LKKNKNKLLHVDYQRVIIQYLEYKNLGFKDSKILTGVETRLRLIFRYRLEIKRMLPARLVRIPLVLVFGHPNH